MSSTVKLDLSRLAVVETLKNDAFGASRKAEEQASDASERVRAKMRRLDELLATHPRDLAGADTKNQQVELLKQQLEAARDLFKAAAAVRDAAYEKSNAASALYDNCKKFAEAAR